MTPLDKPVSPFLRLAPFYRLSLAGCLNVNLIGICDMPSVSVRLSKSQIDDLVAMCGLGAPGLNRIADALERTRPTIRRSELRRVISEAGGSGPALEATVRALPGLATAIRRFNITPRDLLESVQSGLLMDRGLSKETEMRWHECSPIVERMLSTAVVSLYAKARELAFDFERLYGRARILTDIRPVYDDMRNTIIGADIIQTLRLEYFSPELENGTISIALDMPDVEQLKKCCEDALQKAEAARKLMENNSLEVVLPGERGAQ